MTFFSFSHMDTVEFSTVNFENLHNSGNQYFLNDHCVMLQNHAWVKEPFKLQEMPMNFDVTRFENIFALVSNST